MLKGDISNVVRPRVMLVFEGALGFIEGENVGQFNALVREGSWYTAWNEWQVNPLMARKIWDVVKRQAIQVEVVTLIIPERYSLEAASGLQDTLDEHGLPVSAVHAMPAERLAREISYMPDLAAVYDANRKTAMMYGGKGRWLQNVNDFGRL